MVLQLDLVRREIPEHVRRIKGYDFDTRSDLCIAWRPDDLERVFLFRSQEPHVEGVYYALIHYPHSPGDEIELLSRSQARALFRRLPEKLTSEEEAFPPRP